MSAPFVAIYAWVTFTFAFPPIEVGTFRGFIKEHNLPCTPAVFVSSTNTFIRPWVAETDDVSFAVYIENLGIPGTPVTVTAHAFCFGDDPLSVETWATTPDLEGPDLEEEDIIPHTLAR